jgi:hypothetical protein
LHEISGDEYEISYACCHGVVVVMVTYWTVHPVMGVRIPYDSPREYEYEYGEG